MPADKTPRVGCDGKGAHCSLISVGVWLAFVGQFQGTVAAAAQLDAMVSDGWLSVAECHGLPRVILSLRAWRRVAAVSGISLN